MVGKLMHECCGCGAVELWYTRRLTRGHGHLLEEYAYVDIPETSMATHMVIPGFALFPLLPVLGTGGGGDGLG